jgi:hypothetical protein
MPNARSEGPQYDPSKKHIDDLKDQASERELIGLLTSDPETRLKHRTRTVEIRDRIATLTARLAKLKRGPS